MFAEGILQPAHVAQERGLAAADARVDAAVLCVFAQQRLVGGEGTRNRGGLAGCFGRTRLGGESVRFVEQ